RRALGELKVAGVRTNIPLHVQVMRSREFAEGRFDTTFLEAGFDLTQSAMRPGDEDAALIAAAILAFTGAGAAQHDGIHGGGSDYHPWRAAHRRSALLDGSAGTMARGWRSHL